MRKFFLILLLSFSSVTFTKAQQTPVESRFTSSVFVGYNFGGLAPVSFPNTIRKIKSYSPGFAPAFGYEVNYKFKPKWAVSLGVRADWKSMKVVDQVQYFHTLVSIDNSSIEGDFTGTNATIVKNIYISLPIQAVYFTDNNWRLKLGIYIARLVRPSFYGTVSDGYLRKGNSLGEKIIITNATFDFENNQRKYDYGIAAGAEKSVYKHLAVKADLQWGLQPVFPKSFTGISFNMYNIFATVGMTYHLK